MASRLTYQPLPLEVGPGHVVLRQGERTEAAWEVLSGALVERVRDRDGRSIVVDIAGPGDVTGSPGGRPAPWEIHSLRAASFRVWEGGMDSAVLRWSERCASLAGELAWLDVRERLELRLDDLGRRFGVTVPGGTRLTLRLTHEELGSLIGASRESVSRAMAELRAAGRVRTDRRGILLTSLRLVREDE